MEKQNKTRFIAVEVDDELMKKIDLALENYSSANEKRLLKHAIILFAQWYKHQSDKDLPFKIVYKKFKEECDAHKDNLSEFIAKYFPAPKGSC